MTDPTLGEAPDPPPDRPAQRPRAGRSRRAGLSRIAVTGVAACATFGLMAGMALGPVGSSEAPVTAATMGIGATAPKAVPAAEPAPRIIIIQRRMVPVAGPSGGGAGGGSGPAPSGGSAPAVAPSPGVAPAATPAPAPVAPAPVPPPVTQSAAS